MIIIKCNQSCRPGNSCLCEINTCTTVLRDFTFFVVYILLKILQILLFYILQGFKKTHGEFYDNNPSQNKKFTMSSLCLVKEPYDSRTFRSNNVFLRKPEGEYRNKIHLRFESTVS